MRLARRIAALCLLLTLTAVCRADDDGARAMAVKNAKITPMQAAVMAAKEVKGGKVFELEVEIDDGVAVYEVRIAYFGEKHTLDIACATGQIVKRSSRGDPRLGLIKWSKITVPIEKAMESALAQMPGQIIEVDIREGAFNPKFEVQIFSNGKKREVHVNTETGQVVKIKND